MIATARLRPVVLTLQAAIILALFGFVFNLEDELALPLLCASVCGARAT